MATKFVPLDKMSKKQQREYYKKKRKIWEFNPATRTEKANMNIRKRKKKCKENEENARFLPRARAVFVKFNKNFALPAKIFMQFGDLT